MATLLKNATMENIALEQEAQRHNAQIKERYRRLQDAEAGQFAEENTTQAVADYTVRASVLTPEREAFSTPTEDHATVTQVPQVTEFLRTHSESPIFTTEKFDRVEERAATVVAPVAVDMPTQMQAPAQVAAIATEAQYSLSALAKTVMAAFAALVIVMLTLICVNSQVIRIKNMRIQNLEEKRQQLIERNAQIQERIQKAQSEETIREYALSQGMIQG